MIYKNILKTFKKRKSIFLLIDPDKYNHHSLIDTVKAANKGNVDLILVGGSLVNNFIDTTVQTIKNNTNLPVVLFPGSLLQLTDKADGILMLSLISGRNPEYLIGQHVIAAPILKKLNLEIIPTGYVLVDTGALSSAAYISNTKPIPSDKIDLVIATAQAGEMLGLKLIYLEAGSGSNKTIPTKLIKAVKNSISLPLIVGGGIKRKEDVNAIFNAGADIIVIGNAIENNHENLIKIFSGILNNF